MKNKYATPQLLVSEVLIETGFATSQGGAGYSDSEGTENMTHDGAYMTL